LLELFYNSNNRIISHDSIFDGPCLLWEGVKWTGL
jgi:hypothetical protein